MWQRQAFDHNTGQDFHKNQNLFYHVYDGKICRGHENWFFIAKTYYCNTIRVLTWPSKKSITHLRFFCYRLSIYLYILCHPHCWVLCAGLSEMEESQDISRHSRDMPMKPPRPEGGSKTTYIPMDFFPYKYFVPGWTRTHTEEVCSSVVFKYSASTDWAILATMTLSCQSKIYHHWFIQPVIQSTPVSPTC